VASILIRKVDESLKSKLRLRAARHGRSMEEEAREILKAGLSAKSLKERSLYDAIRKHIDPIGGVELELPPREPTREPPRLDE
jgi:antitoxin FitA